MRWAEAHRGVRVPLPRCTIRIIRREHPDGSHRYRGFMPGPTDRQRAENLEGEPITGLTHVRRGSNWVLENEDGEVISSEAANDANVKPIR